ncbi:PLEKHA8 [Lepeophtheirus salmonis]|uniref:PLEKHA8 n=1 Tax=Lepeophtheirus salmonis TaxID=72036 RepID=A0A7R8CM13_LEPSM|nr:PLEKHA8 [Lepeophtheirus salmonis]CAF2862376.1 PLEKHA8 [Lepeophtheirus salmonis]
MKEDEDLAKLREVEVDYSSPNTPFSEPGEDEDEMGDEEEEGVQISPEQSYYSLKASKEGSSLIITKQATILLDKMMKGLWNFTALLDLDEKSVGKLVRHIDDIGIGEEGFFKPLRDIDEDNYWDVERKVCGNGRIIGMVGNYDGSFWTMGGTLSYFKSQEEENEGCKGSLNVSSCEIRVHPTDLLRLDISISGEQTTNSEKERQEWLVGLGSVKACVQKSDSTRRCSEDIMTKRSELKLVDVEKLTTGSSLSLPLLLARGLIFIHNFLRHMMESDDTVEDSLTIAYETALKNYKGGRMETVYKDSLKNCPSREEFLVLLGLPEETSNTESRKKIFQPKLFLSLAKYLYSMEKCLMILIQFCDIHLQKVINAPNSTNTS